MYYYLNALITNNKVQVFSDHSQIYYSFPVTEQALVVEFINEDPVRVSNAPSRQSLASKLCIMLDRRVERDKSSNFYIKSSNSKLGGLDIRFWTLFALRF